MKLLKSRSYLIFTLAVFCLSFIGKPGYAGFVSYDEHLERTEKRAEDFVGVMSHPVYFVSNEHDRALFTERLDESGAKCMRIVFPMEVWENHSFTIFDKTLNAIPDDVDILVSLRSERQPIDPVEFANFAYQVAHYYKDRIQEFQIWNEQNNRAFWKGTPEEYIELLKHSFYAIKHANPQAIVVLGGMAYNGIKGLDEPYIQENYLEKLFELGAGNYCDKIDVHPYESLGTSAIRSVLQVYDTDSVKHFFGHGDLETIMTENGTRAWNKQEEQIQADKLREYYNLFYSTTLEKFYYFTLTDIAQNYNPGVYATFGLLTENYKKKPAFEAFQDIVDTIDEVVPPYFQITSPIDGNVIVKENAEPTMIDVTSLAFDPNVGQHHGDGIEYIWYQLVQVSDGIQVLKEKVNHNVNQEIKWDISDLDPGVYMVRGLTALDKKEPNALYWHADQSHLVWDMVRFEVREAVSA